MSSRSPAPSSTGVSFTIDVTATFSEPVQPASISFALRDSTNTIVPAVVGYDSATRTAILNPNADLLASAMYTATINGAADLAGNVLASPVVWSFTTATPGFQESVVFSGLDNPTAIEFASDGRVFVAEKSGVIKVFDGLSDTTPTVFADLSTQVHNFWDRGLLGMALDPEFPNRPYVYVLYTHDAPIGGAAPVWGTLGALSDPCPNPPGATANGCVVSARLSRLQANGSVMTGTETVLVEDWFQQFPSHSIGSLAFGPDGALYASAGDGASFNYVDYGQTGNPNNDPPNEGGALRSQDLRTPADPVTLDGTIIRLDPDTGQPLSAIPAMAIGSPTVDAAGVQSYSVTSVFQGPSPTVVRVLEPANPAPGKPHRFLYVLPVAAGLTGLGSEYSDGLEELRLLDVPNRFNVTLIAPTFHIESWYGDHSSDPTRRLEAFVVQDLVPFGDTFAAAGETPERWLIGFSKSGNGVLTLGLRHPNVFNMIAAWDAPAQLSDLSAFPGMAENFGTEENFDRYEIPPLVIESAAAFQQANRIWISGDDSGWTEHMQQLHEQLDQEGIPHTFTQTGPRIHHWGGGWLESAVQSLDANSLATQVLDANAQRIIAHGLRNPFRFTFRPGTREIWVGDVGWNAWEEINVVPDAADGTIENFGWPCYEGTGTSTYSTAGLPICSGLYAQPNADTEPFFSYQHGQPVVAGESCGAGSSSISGLAFYGTGAYPPEYEGALFFSDYSRNCIWVVLAGQDGLPVAASRATFVPGAPGPVELEIGPGGDLFYVSLNTGTVRRIRHSSGNLPPTAVIQAAPVSGSEPLVVTFDGTASSDPSGDALTYAWDLDGDGTFDDSDASITTATFTGSGAHAVHLSVTDPQGLSDVASVVISTNDTAPVATILAPAAGTNWAAGDVINFSGSATDPEDGALPPGALMWSLILHHCPSSCHTHSLQDYVGVGSGSFSAPDHEYPSHLELRLTATDSGGLQTGTSVLLFPKTVTLTFQTVPTGLQLAVGSSNGVTPFTRTVIANSMSSVSTASPQSLSGISYQFVSWSDGGSQSHNIVAPATDQTYTASFQAVMPPVPSGLVAAYGFNEASGTTTQDVSGNNLTGTISGATRTTAGKFGSALAFDGTDDWVTVNAAAPLNLTTGMTLEAWVFPTTTTGVRDIMVKEGAGADIYNLYAGNWRGLPESNVFVDGINRTAEGTALPPNVWTHVAGTYDGTTLRLFINGVQVASTAIAGAIATSADPLRIGGNSMWGEFFAGLIDEVRIYNRALTPTEVQTDMNTAVGAPPSDTTSPVRSNGQPTGTLAAGTTQASLSLTTDEVATCRYALSPDVAYGSMPSVFATTGGTAHSTPVSGLINGGSYSYYVRCQDIAANANGNDYVISFSVATALPPGAGLVAAYGFDEASGATTQDASGNNLTGTSSGAARTTAGKFGSALAFDGIDDWVTVSAAAPLDLTTGMTLEAWVFPTTTTGVRDIALKEGAGVDIYNLYARNWRGLPESNVLVTGVNHTAEGTALPANLWTHVAGTYDGTTLRLFINGAQAASTAIAGSIAVSTGPLRIGGNATWGEYFQGLIDEVRIYSRALSGSEIQTDMNTAITP